MALLLFGVFILLLLLGVPVAFSICAAAAVTMFMGFGDAKMMIVVQRMFASCDSFSLIAVPFFDPKKLVNKFFLDAFDPASQEPEYKICAARIRKA